MAGPSLAEAPDSVETRRRVGKETKSRAVLNVESGAPSAGLRPLSPLAGERWGYFMNFIALNFTYRVPADRSARNVWAAGKAEWIMGGFGGPNSPPGAGRGIQCHFLGLDTEICFGAGLGAEADQGNVRGTSLR